MLTADEMQAAQPPTDWSLYDGSALADSRNGANLPPGMGPGFDDKLHVRFLNVSTIDVRASQTAQRPIYKDVPYIEIMVPGDKNNIVHEPVWDLHKRRFPQHWAQFCAGQADQVVGTPLKVAPFMTDSLIDELAYFKIRTIEQLADLADSNLTFMGARELKEQAKKFIARTTGADAMMERIKALEAALAAKGAELPEGALEEAPTQAIDGRTKQGRELRKQQAEQIG